MASRITSLFKSQTPGASMIVRRFAHTGRRICITERQGDRIVYKDDGVDYKHWLIQVKKPAATATREEIISSYIRILASVVESEVEAKKRLYSVSTRHYFAFGALMTEELSSKFSVLPEVLNVIPDAYVNYDTKDYGGEPFVDGEALPYDRKYHELYHRAQAAADAAQAAAKAKAAEAGEVPTDSDTETDSGMDMDTDTDTEMDGNARTCEDDIDAYRPSYLRYI